jgi:hypothetical protein
MKNYNENYLENGTGYTLSYHNVLRNNMAIEPEIGTKLHNKCYLSISFYLPVTKTLFQSDFAYYDSGTPYGNVQTTETPATLLFHLKRPIEVRKRPKKEKPIKPPKEMEVPVNVLSKVNNRKVNVQETYTTKSSEIIILLYDNASADGDTSSLDFNGEWILENYPVNKTPVERRLELKQGENNLALYAESLGTTLPNTAAITIVDGDKRKNFVLNSDYNHCGTIRIYRE